MPNKTERIFSYLPSTFQKRPQGPTLRAVIDAFGRELQDGENSLAAVMQSHWVDYADHLASQIDDLQRLAALYGLAPRPDEGVEMFREHLKRYIRTFLEGTVTVQGILRITAEALGLHIADQYADSDTWWTRGQDAVTITSPDGKDAAQMLLGTPAAYHQGQSATAAQVRGTVDLSGKVDCREHNLLRLKVDDSGPFEIDIAAGAEDVTAVSGQHIADKINAEVGQTVATFDGRFLTLTSPQRGSNSLLDVQDLAPAAGLSDAAEKVIGLPPRAYYGRGEEPARIRGTVDLRGVLDLSQTRYLRLLIDGTPSSLTPRLAEIDCAGPDESHTLLDQVVEKVNAALGLEALSHDGRFLTLSSPTTGLGSSIVFQQAAAQQALLRLFGPISKTHIGRGPRAAQVVGRRDLSAGVDLSQVAFIQLRLDGIETGPISCAGEDPANTQLPELVNAINAGARAEIANHNGRFLSLTSASNGPGSEIIFLTPAAGDATERLFGLGPRLFRGHAATAARLIGVPDLSNGVDLRARHLLRLRVDGRSSYTIDLRRPVPNESHDPLRQLADRIDAAVGENGLPLDVATTDGQHLILVSTTTGSGSSLEIVPITEQQQERFVTRAMVTDEAATAVFGYTHRQASGADASNARVVGKVDLQRGVDLRQTPYLRLIIDDHAPVDIDCAGSRPRATLIDEIVGKINQALNLAPFVASHNGRRLILSSHALGRHSRIAFGPPRNADALDLLLKVPPGEYRGLDAEQVRFVGTADLSSGVDLRGGDKLKIGLDGAEPVEIACATHAADLASVAANHIMIAINLALGKNVVLFDGRYLRLTSPTVGAESQLVFAVPSTGDATQAIFGIAAPRTYRGRDAAPAQVTGTVDLSNGESLSVIRFLRLSVDGKPARDVDCLLPDAVDQTAVTLDEMVAAINNALNAKVASHNDHNLILTSPTTGQVGRLTVAPHSSGDARQILFGSVPDATSGLEAMPATLLGAVDLLSPANLSQRRQIRLAVNGGLPTDIDIAGVSPETTFLDEIVKAINAVFPDLASATPESHLQLTAPTAGQGSRLELLPLRTIDLIEYPPVQIPFDRREVRHGDRWFVDNTGATAVGPDASHVARITAPWGISGPTLVNETLGWQIRLLTALGPGETVYLWAVGQQLLAAICGHNLCDHNQPLADEPRFVPGHRILVGPPGGQAWLPFAGTWHLSGDGGEPATLQLNNPLAEQIVQLQARQFAYPGQAIGVQVVESDISPVAFDPVAQDGQTVVINGRIQTDSSNFYLTDGAGHKLVRLRAGAGVDLAASDGRVVNVYGTLHPDEAEPLLIVQQVEAIFTVTLTYTLAEGEPITEQYPAVTIGQGPTAAHLPANDLVRQLYAGGQLNGPSRLVRAVSWPKSTVLQLPQGRSSWRFLDCYAPRFNSAHFDEASFPGDLCPERGVFNISRFANSPPELVTAVYTSSHDLPDAPVQVELIARRYQPGAFRVRLPADLPEPFGGRFNESRFGQSQPELYEKAVTEPRGDDFHIMKLLNNHSAVVEAEIVPRVPLGWQAIAMPFRQPHYLTLGDEQTEAQIYLSEPGIDGFLRIYAQTKGSWGNQIAVAARASGPAMVDFSVIYQGVPFENGRQVVLGQPLAILTQQSLEPGPMGVLQAKAAGTHVQVSREHTPEVGEPDSPLPDFIKRSILNEYQSRSRPVPTLRGVQTGAVDSRGGDERHAVPNSGGHHHPVPGGR